MAFKRVVAAAMGRGVVVLFMLLPGIAGAFTVSLDQFQVNRFDLPNNGLLFVDPFEDGVPPPSAPNFSNGNPAQYFVFGAIAPGAESGGKLALDSSIGTPVQNALGEDRLLTRTTFGTDISTSTGLGLKRNHSFTVAARFDLVPLPTPIDNYGVELHDAVGVGTTVELVQLLVRRANDPADTSLHLRFQKQTISGPGQGIQVLNDLVLAPPSEANQIALLLRHATPDTDTITAEYRYANSGNPLSDLIPLAGATTMFNGETFVRGSFAVSQVPEPGTYAMLLAGLVLLGWVARRRIKT